MTSRIRPMIALLAVLISSGLFTGCQNSREIDTLFFITGLSLDATENPSMVALTVQIGGTNQQSGGSSSGGGASEKESAIVLKAQGDTVMAGLSELNKNSNRRLLLHHNQVLLFGTQLAEQGVQKHIDLLIRDQQARLEVPLALVEGRAEELLKAELPQTPLSGVYMSSVFKRLFNISPHYRVRLIDFMSRSLEGSTAPTMPILKLDQAEEKKPELKVDGMGVFKDDKLVGRLDADQTIGFLFSLGKVNHSAIEVSDGKDRAMLNVETLSCKRKVTLEKDKRKGVKSSPKVSLDVHATLNIAELSGFSKMKPEALTKKLTKLAKEEIRGKMERCLEKAQELKADVFGYGTEIYQQHPKEWKSMKSRWDDLFEKMDCEIKVDAQISATGQILQSLGMEKNMNKSGKT